ncbi:MAG: peptide chain release factor N(5)-glutamine methyltransferase [Planctomycetota bacterium]|jgi:release factor glutamine methyltransferase
MSQTADQPWTIQRLLVWTTDFFKQKGRDAPRLAAEVLLAEALGCRRIELYTRYEEVPAEPHLSRYRDWVKRHAAGEPVAYLVGHRDFYSLGFRVTPDVLIPRPETELLVVETLDALKQLNRPHPLVVDVGTGSGCVAVAIASQASPARLFAVDISPAALAIARENATAHKLEDRIEFLQSNLLENLPPAIVPDVVVSNPPYVGRNEVGTLAEDVRKYEPESALFGGERGDELTARLIEQAAQRLAPGGWLIFETSPMLAARCLEKVRETGAFAQGQIKKDLARLDRAIVARKQG